MSLARLVAAMAAVIVALCAGLYLGGHPGDLPGPVKDAFVDDSVRLTADATEVIKGNYFRSVSDSQIDESSLNGIISSLRSRYHDRFSQYLDPQDLGSFNQRISGRLTGVGLGISQVKRGLRVGEVYDGSPAERAGILPGEIIVSVDGESIAGKDSDLVTGQIKGREGTKVTIGVLSPSSGETRQIRLTRQEIKLPNVEAHMRRVGSQRVGYIQFASFTERIHGPLRDAVDRVRTRGAKGLVLDMRGNGGGLLQEAIRCASIFVSKGKTIVSTRSRTQPDVVYRAPGGDIGAFPVVVLVDRDTASAAEILTAALADDNGATVVGTRTYGKGVYQRVLDLPNGGALDLTVGEFYTADGTNLAGEGFQPDVAVRDDPKTPRDEGLRRALDVLGSELSATPAG